MRKYRHVLLRVSKYYSPALKQTKIHQSAAYERESEFFVNECHTTWHMSNMTHDMNTVTNQSRNTKLD